MVSQQIRFEQLKASFIPPGQGLGAPLGEEDSAVRSKGCRKQSKAARGRWLRRLGVAL